jgi:hypothetical protein
MVRSIAHFLLCCSILLSACDNADKSETEQTEGDIRFKTFTYSNQTGDCVSPNGACFTIRYSYPEIEYGKAGQKESFNRSMAELVQSHLKDFLLDPIQSSNTEDIIQKLFDEYSFMVSELGDSSAVFSWQIEMDAEVLYMADPFLTISVAYASYTGGAHPDNYVKYLNYSLPELKSLQLTDIINDREKVTAFAEEIFRDTYEIPQGESLEDHGYWFEGNAFYLPENFAITPSGILFTFNPYEIGPYAIGIHEIKLPYELIRQYLILQPDHAQ